MNKLTMLLFIVVAVTAVAVADVLTKKVSVGTDSYAQAIRNPLMLIVVALYILQILIFLYVFVKKAELGTVGIVQTALFALIVLGSGILFFNERFTLLKAIGVGLAIVGVALLSL
ncbi:MAG: hypothetical protein U0517_03075 [Candidatus Andersenbacteria bacterium]